jgi:hypothetical protein
LAYFQRTPELIYSPLCRSYEQDGHHLKIQIYRLADQPSWKLEVINEEGTSTVWKRRFAIDRHADEAFQFKLAREGLEVFLGDDE